VMKLTKMRIEQLREIIQRLTVHRGDEFTLTSGKKASLYFDMKATTMDPVGGHLAAEALLALIADAHFDYITGVALGAVPLVARMIELSGKDTSKPGLISRSGVKTHGMARQIEGIRDPRSLRGKRAIVIEDVTTTGGSISIAVAALRELGAEVNDAACLVRRSPDAQERLQKEGVDLRYIFTEADFS
jgi:orotate phosphoribosyltransferase